jgi:hypothetical protein
MRIRELNRHDDAAPDFWWTLSGSTYDVRHADPVTMTWKALSVSPPALLAWPVDFRVNHSHVCN